MGTQLLALGLEPEENAATWNILHPTRVRQVHQAYLRAGAQAFLTNTLMLGAASFREQLEARVGRDVLGDFWRRTLRLLPSHSFRIAAFGPLAGVTHREFDDIAVLTDTLRQTRQSATRGARLADAILLETCSSPRVGQAIRHLHRTQDEPIMLSLTFLRNESGRLVTASGHRPEWFAQRAGQFGLAALGVNCGRDIGLDDVIEIVQRYRTVTDVPLFARPNAGTPVRRGRHWDYPMTPRLMADRLPELIRAGVCMVGGCCGTTPAHIAALRKVLRSSQTGG